MEGITNQEIWDFIQKFKSMSKKEFGNWLLGQKEKPIDKIIKAVIEYNEKGGSDGK